MSQRFVFLDGLRDIAAIFVFVSHSWAMWGFAFTRSYLAVDLFFVMSGFVIAQAYDDKLLSGALNAFQFVRIRIIPDVWAFGLP